MCNPAERTSPDYDPQRNNVLVSEMDNRAVCADTDARVAEGTIKEMANHSDVVDVPMSSVSSRKANGVGGNHSCSTHEHFAEKVPIQVRGSQGIAEEFVDQKGEPSKTCLALTTPFSEGDRIDEARTYAPGFRSQNSSKTSEYDCDLNLVESGDNVHPISAKSRKVEAKPMETAILQENFSPEETKSQMEGKKLDRESLQETNKDPVGDLVSLDDLHDEANGETSIKAVRAQSCTSVSGGSQSAANPAEALSIDSSRKAENTEIQDDIAQTNCRIKVDDRPALEGLGVGSQDLSTEPCSDRDNVKAENSSGVKSDANKEAFIDFNEPLAWIDMRPMRLHVAERTAASAEESSSGAVLIASNVEETKNESTASSLETQNKLQRPEQMKQDVGRKEHAEIGIPTTAMSSEEDAAEHVPRSFEEANGEIQGEIQQEDTIKSADRTHSIGISPPDLAKFFNSARGLEQEEEIEEQEYPPVMAMVPLEKKLFMESPRSLRMLLVSEETAPSTKKDEKHNKDGKTMEFSSKTVPAKDSYSNERRTELSYPAKWYESSDNEEAPIVFSGALTHQGMLSYAGQILYSGSISHRSDSSTSTRSFAFPILGSECNSSPVRMAPPDPWSHRRSRRKWHFCLCCRRSST